MMNYHDKKFFVYLLLTVVVVGVVVWAVILGTGAQ